MCRCVYVHIQYSTDANTYILMCKQLHTCTQTCIHIHCQLFWYFIVAINCVHICACHALSFPSPDWYIIGHQCASISVLFGNSRLVLLPWCHEAGSAARVLDFPYQTCMCKWVVSCVHCIIYVHVFVSVCAEGPDVHVFHACSLDCFVCM